jgi:hypothetical protein
MVGGLALLLLAIGLNFLFNPVAAAAQFGLAAEGVRGLNSVRGDLGGLFLGSAVLLGIGLVRRQGACFLAVAVLMGAIASGRLVGFVLDGRSGNSIAEFVLELVIVAVLVLAYRRSGAPR